MSGEFGFERTLSWGFDALISINPSRVYSALQEAGVACFYPGFEDWFYGKVVPGVRTGERRLILSLIDGDVSGVAICKKTKTEKKLCTLWVSPLARHRGIAAELADTAFEWLSTTKPLFTVPEERLTEFRGLLRSWSFSEPIKYQSFYRQDRIEFAFNGRITGITQ